MCTNYQSTKKDALGPVFALKKPLDGEWKNEVWQDYQAPIIVHNARRDREAVLANYGMVPKAKMPPGIKRYSTMNARAETIGELRSFAKPWREGRLCLIPMACFFEPCYESGKAERYCIALKEISNFAVAGIYREWAEEDGMPSFSFSQITINADAHSVMRRFHKPGEEKRSLVILAADEYDDWLSCKNPEYARSFLQLFDAELMTATLAVNKQNQSNKPANKPAGEPKKLQVDTQGQLF